MKLICKLFYYIISLIHNFFFSMYVSTITGRARTDATFNPLRINLVIESTSKLTLRQ